MEESYLNLDDFPDSPYANELRRGVSAAPFAKDIEVRYLPRHLARVKPRTRLWFSITFLAALAFSILQVNTYGLWSTGTLLHFGIAVPAAIFMTFLVWTRWYERWFMAAAAVVVPVTEALVVVLLVQIMANGQPQAVGSLVLNIFAVFFFAGLMFRFALLAGLVMLGTFAVAANYSQLPAELAFTSLLMTAVTVVLSAIVHRSTEIAYRRSFLEGELVRDLAARDGLTGVMNRRAFNDHLRRVWQQALRDRRVIGLVMIDLDYFKAYNDFHGHQAGDAALRQVAQIIQGFARRPLDMAARYGGEEFAMIFYDLPQDKLAAIAEQLRQAVVDRQIEHGAGQAQEFVTVSVGVGLVQPALGRSPEGAVQFADEALYQAKEAGRNRVFVRGGDDYRALQTGAFSGPRTIQIRS